MIWPVSGQISVRQYVGHCLTRLFYCGAVSKSFILETLVENLSLLFLGKIFLNTLSSVLWTTGRLLFCCGSLTSWTVRRSTRDLTFLRSRNMVQPPPGCSWPGILPLSLRSVLFSTTTHRLDRSVNTTTHRLARFVSD